MEKVPISHDEIRNAVWSCGDNKSPGPDGFTFEFFRKFWNVIGPDFCAAVDWFFLHSAFAKGCNSSFIALIPKTPDANFRGAFYLLMKSFLCKFKQKQAMVFKVDFAKAYDSVRWDFLDDVLEAFGFGFKWRSWVLGSLSSGMASIVINGSPTTEFKFHCGLKQGFGVSREMVNDAASSLGCAVMRAPFKYLGVMVGGNMSMVKTWDEDVGKGLQKRDSGMSSGLVTSYSMIVSLGFIFLRKERLMLLWCAKLMVLLSGFFRNIRCSLMKIFFLHDSVATRWVKFIPIKINVFAWRVYLDRLPTRLNLNRRNIQVLDQSCPVCKDAAEEVSHLFFSCPLAVDVHRLICRWWNLTWSPLSSYEEWLSWFKDIRLGSILKCMLE
ncbi:RNA-directed DNA polymerase, eukaryota, partial [Tanacetum coccineum]